MILSPAQNAALFAALSDGVLVLDADGRVLHADERFCAITGYEADAVHGATPPFEWWPDEPAGVLHDDVEAVVRRRDGGRVMVRVTDRAVGGEGPGAGGRVRTLRALDGDLSATAVRWRRAAAQEAALRRVAEAGGRDADPAAVLQVAAREVAALLDARWVAVYRDEAATARVLAVHGTDAEGEVGDAEHPAAGSALAGVMRGDRWAANGDEAGIEVSVGAGARGMMVVRSPGCAPDRCRDVVERFQEALGPALAAAGVRARLARQATTDSLTGLANHRAFHERLGDEVARARRHGRPLALCVLDIDDFKEINDLHGHQAGDRVLVDVADHLRHVARAGDLVARVGGDEFAWVLPESGGARALEAVDRVRALMAATPAAQPTVSVGVCDLADADDAAQLFRLADGALYWAKTHGRDQSRLYDPRAGDVLSAHERMRRRRRSQAGVVLRGLADKVDAMHAGYDHSRRVAALAARLAGQVGWPDADVPALREAARLHDIGKIGLPCGAAPTTIAEVIAGEATGDRFARLGSQLVADALTAEQCAWIHDQRELYDARVRLDADPPYGAHIIAVADAWDVGVRLVGSTGSDSGALFDAVKEGAGTRFCPRVVAALGQIAATDGMCAPSNGARGSTLSV